MRECDTSRPLNCSLRSTDASKLPDIPTNAYRAAGEELKEIVAESAVRSDLERKKNILEARKPKLVDIHRRIKYRQCRIDGMTPYEAAISAGFPKDIALRARKRIEPYTDFSVALIRSGITTQVLADKLNDQLNATKKIVTKEHGIIEDVDWVARDKALDKALDYVAPIDKDKETQVSSGISINIHLPDNNKITSIPVTPQEVHDIEGL